MNILFYGNRQRYCAEGHHPLADDETVCQLCASSKKHVYKDWQTTDLLPYIIKAFEALKEPVPCLRIAVWIGDVCS